MNRISKQPREIELADNLGTAEFWVIFVDGEQITSNARPFNAATTELVLDECETCSFCGMKEVTVRKLGDSSIVWYVTLDPAYTPKLRRDRLLIFDRSEYENVFGEESDSLENFGRKDIQHFLRGVTMPDWHDSLYTIPELPSDPMGRWALRIFIDTLNDDRLRFHIDETIETHSILRIGVDVAGIPETVVHFNFGFERIAFRLNANPWLPFWMSHPTMSTELRELIAGSEIAR